MTLPKTKIITKKLNLNSKTVYMGYLKKKDKIPDKN